MRVGGRTLAALLVLATACTASQSVERTVATTTPSPSSSQPPFVRYFVDYEGGGIGGMVEVDRDRRTFCSTASVPWARSAHLHYEVRQAGDDPVVLTLFEPPQRNRDTVCVRDVAPGVLERIVADPGRHYVDFHERDDGGHRISGVLKEEPAYEGLQVEVPNPLFVRGGDAFAFPVTARDGEGEINGFMVRFGDGRTWGGLPFDLVCDGVVGEEDPREGPSFRQETLRHAYRWAGEYQVTVVATSGGCHASSEESRSEMTITVEGDARASNGPLGPRAKIGHAYYTNGNRRVLVSDIGGYDEDGFVYRIAVDWGDGGARQVLTRSFRECREGRGWPDGWFSKSLRHRYDERGEYEVSVKVRSAGCDRRDRSTDRVSRVLEYPPEQGS